MLGFFFIMIYLNDDITQFDLSAAMPRLTAQRREQVLRFRNELGQKLCAAAFLLLCDGLREEYGITQPPILAYEEDGKPFLADYPNIHFNVSHCPVAAICAVAPHPVGIDIERIRPYNESVVRYTMNDEELRQIEASSRPDVAFIRLWTMKEALLKLSGSGIRKDMKDVLTGKEQFTTVVNTTRGYVYSVCCKMP